MSTHQPPMRPAFIEQLRDESRGIHSRPAARTQRPGRCRPSPEDSRRLFTVEKGNRWLELARREPEAKMLFGELWHQGELCMMFADTNTGKSVLAVQIGDSIARGQTIAPFTCQTPPERVLYIDFELTRAQFGLRYSNGSEDHELSDNFFRAEYNFLPDPPPNVNENDLLIAGIEYKINQVKATVLIIDNITCLRGGTENSAVALALMKSLKALKTDYQLSILVLAHTPKRRNATQPISADDLHGSKLLINFADSAFAIGQSTVDNDLCYLKQIKQRNTRQRYGHNNVCLCRIEKPGTFLQFKFEGYSAEHRHLLTRTAADRLQLAEKIAALTATGLSQRDISNQLGIGLATVNRLLRYTDAPMTYDQKECPDEAGVPKNCHTEALACPEVARRKVRPEPGITYEERSHEEHGAKQTIQPPLLTDSPITYNKEEFADEEGWSDHPITNNQKRWADEAKVSPTGGDLEGAYTDAPMTNDTMTNNNVFNSAWDRNTSTIDALLTPELLDQILRTTMCEKGDDNLNPPNIQANAEADYGGP